MRRIVEALFYDPLLCGRRVLCATAIRLEHRPGCLGSLGGGAGFAVPAWSRRRCRRARGPTTASQCRRWSWRAAVTNCCRRAGRPRSPAQIASARSAVIPDAGHCPQIEQPAAVNELLLDFPGRAARRCSMTDELAGKVAIVTGGASGLGEGLARRFAAEGAKVVIGDVDTRQRCGARGGHRRQRRFRRSRRVRHRAGERARVDGRRPIRWPARDGQQRRGVGHDAPPVPRRRPRRLPQGDGGQRSGCDGRDAGCRPAHVATRRRLDHQPDIDRRDPGRRRGDDLPGVEGRCHPVHQVGGNRVGAL